MNLTKTIGAFGALVLAATTTFAAPAYYVITTTDMVGNKSYDVCEKEEMVARQKQAVAEAKVFPKAVAKLKKEWEAPDKKDSHQFKWQGQRLKPRTVKASQPYPNCDKAVAKADKMTDKELGLDEKPKKKKKLSEKEEEKLYKDRMRNQELEELAQAVQKEIEAMLAEAAAPAK